MLFSSFFKAGSEDVLFVHLKDSAASACCAVRCIGEKCKKIGKFVRNK